MKTIQKRADEIKRGDIIVDFLRAADVRVPAVVLGDYCNGSVKIFDAADTISRVMIGYESTVTVDAPSLNPAQLHAEELADLAKAVANYSHSISVLREEACALLDKIKPPEPPTLEEALTALDNMIAMLADELPDDDDDILNAISIRDRARRAGVMP